MKLGISSDHGGFELKEHIKEYLKEENIEYIDYGTYSLDSVDYPDYGEKLARALVEGEVDRGITICGTGIGISITCNKVKGIRCALVNDTFSARMSKEHNDANIIALGARVIGKDLAIELVSTWLNSKFAGDRHKRRIDKIAAIEEGE